MIIIDDKQVAVSDIKRYSGNDEVMLMLKKAYDKAYHIGFPLTFKYAPGRWKVNAKSGLREGKRFLLIKRYETFKTKNGVATVRWADTNINNAEPDKKYGSPNYIFRKLRILNENDIEEAIFLLGISQVITKGNIVVVEDVVADAKDVADRRAGEADITHLIYSKYSKVSKDRLLSLAYAWGVTGIAAMKGSIDAIKNALFDRVAYYEKEKHDPNFGYNAFIEAAMATETPEFVECMEVVTKAELAGTVVWDKRNFAWVVIGGEKGENYQLMVIDPAQSAKRKELLAREIMGNSRKKAMLTSSESSQERRTQSKPENTGNNSNDDDDPITDISQLKTDGEKRNAYSKFQHFNDKQWKQCSPDEFSLAKSMAKIDDELPMGVAIATMKKFFSEINPF